MAPPADRARWGVLGLVLAVQTAASFGPVGLPALAPLIRADVGLSRTAAGSLLSAYYVGSFLMAAPAGYLADRLGVRWTLVGGQAALALFLLLLSGLDRAPLLLGSIVAVGLGFGVVNPTTTKAVIAWFPARDRATVVGIKQTGLPLGGAIGAAVLPLLAIPLGWRGAVRVAAAAVAACAVATALAYREAPAAAGGAAAGTPSPWRVLRSRDVWLVSIATILFAGLQASLLGYLVLFLQERQGLSVVAAGRVLAGAQMAGLAGRIVFGVLSDRLFGGRRRVVLFLAGATSACLAAAMARVGPGTPLWVVAPLSLLFGFVGIGWNGVQLTLLAELAGKALAGTAVGLGLAVSAVGVIAVPPAFGRLVEATGDYRWAWLSLTGIMLAALLLLVPVREPARRR